MLDPVDENIYQNDELKHWGIIGMKWGIRRYQNPDGTLTPEGKQRYLKSENAKGNYINDNWRRAEKEVKNKLDADKRYQKFKDKKYYEWYDEEVNGDYRKDYYSILFDKTQKFLEKEYDRKVSDDWAEKTYYSATKPENLKKNQIYVESTGMVYTTRPFTSNDNNDPNLKEILRLFNLKTEDLVIDEDSDPRLASVFRKDGKPVKWTDGKYKYEEQDLRYIADEGDWPYNKYFKPIK